MGADSRSAGRAAPRFEDNHGDAPAGLQRRLQERTAAVEALEVEGKASRALVRLEAAQEIELVEVALVPQAYEDEQPEAGVARKTEGLDSDRAALRDECHATAARE